MTSSSGLTDAEVTIIENEARSVQIPFGVVCDAQSVLLILRDPSVHLDLAALVQVRVPVPNREELQLDPFGKFRQRAESIKLCVEMANASYDPMKVVDESGNRVRGIDQPMSPRTLVPDFDKDLWVVWIGNEGNLGILLAGHEFESTQVSLLGVNFLRHGLKGWYHLGFDRYMNGQVLSNSWTRLEGEESPTQFDCRRIDRCDCSCESLDCTVINRHHERRRQVREGRSLLEDCELGTFRDAMRPACLQDVISVVGFNGEKFDRSGKDFLVEKATLSIVAFNSGCLPDI